MAKKKEEAAAPAADQWSVAPSVQADPIPDVPSVQISPTSATVSSQPGEGTFSVTITGEGLSGTWIVYQDAAATWLAIKSPPMATDGSGNSEPQSIDGEVRYAWGLNSGTAARTAHMYVNGKTFTLDQVEFGGVVPPIEPPPVEPPVEPPPEEVTVPLVAGSGQELKEGLREKRRRERMAEKGY